jgi:hypothetical protein
MKYFQHKDGRIMAQEESYLVAAWEAATRGDLLNAGKNGAGIVADEQRQAAKAVLDGDRLARLAKNGTSTPDERARFEALGIVFGNDYDDLLVTVTLPEGWKLGYAGGGDSRHMGLIDDKGRMRAPQFVKGASYDRYASIYLKPRYHVSYTAYDLKDAAGNRDSQMGIWDQGVEPSVLLWSGPRDSELRAQHPDKPSWDIHDMRDQVVQAKLLEMFPDATNPLAYWD